MSASLARMSASLARMSASLPRMSASLPRGCLGGSAIVIPHFLCARDPANL